MMFTSSMILGIGAFVLFLIFIEALKNATKRMPDLNIRRALMLYATWIAFACAVGNSGALADFSTAPPKMMMMLAAVFVTSVIFVRSETGRAIAVYTPLWALVGFQGFRILAELALYQGYQEGVFPIQMTFEGMNFDIVTAVLALILIPILKHSPEQRWLAWGFNVVGTVLLTTILVIAVLSMPTPMRQFMNEPANTAVALFPHILLPAVLVQGAIVGHLLLTMRLLGLRKAETPSI